MIWKISENVMLAVLANTMEHIKGPNIIGAVNRLTASSLNPSWEANEMLTSLAEPPEGINKEICLSGNMLVKRRSDSPLRPNENGSDEGTNETTGVDPVAHVGAAEQQQHDFLPERVEVRRGRISLPPPPLALI